LLSDRLLGMALFASRSACRLMAEAPLVDGKLPIAGLAAARRLAGRVAAAIQDRAEPTDSRPPTAGEIYALSRIEEALQRLMGRYLEDRDPEAITRVRVHLVERLGSEESDRLLSLFGLDFSLAGGAETSLRELPVWMVIDENPAAAAATSLLLAGPFRSDRNRAPMLESLELGLAGEGADSETHESLFDLLRAPARAEPESLAGQLRYLLDRWAELLGLDRDDFLRGLDLLAEEAKSASLAPGGGRTEVPSFAGLEDDREQYSSDRDWMPSLVLLAKNVYVWLHQLSVSFDRPIDRVDRIPDEALDEIAHRGFTGLWLIGVWERSAASRRLKRMCGNPEAEASAYSVRGYRIADDLGGEAAIEDLRRRCADRGLRLAADMVPNHMGIDSDWLLDEPQRFLSTSSSPFSAYTFGGTDFSPRPEIGIYVEDHYFDRSDAAVVFKRVDRRSGEERFVYHGNDGTHMPWNDTAQLDYLNPETREAVIQTILEVARRFPIIRFDAAMTLARKHFQRLWFPEPGSGGAIPSRAERGLSREGFAEQMPVEFWREVVDRVAAEVPDTLLLAEAFWLMEGYFVRTLGMHRVYNSAFMHMVRDQQNGEFRELLKETLAFDPRILRRYVNFLTNPDERTAIDQFGSDDRYFGACVLLATLPGLPMFGHGQVEGHAEKYGMEYRRSYLDEPADETLVARHEREIFPLLRRRRHFAGVENFELYDFVEDGGGINENVFAYSNGDGQERSLVVFNNSFATLSGRLLKSAARSTRAGLQLSEALGLGGGEDGFWIFDERISGCTFLRSAAAAAESGLHLEISGFGYRVFEGFRVAGDDAKGRYRTLEGRLAGNGVADLDHALSDLDLEPAVAALRELFGSPALLRAASHPRGGDTASDIDDLVDATRRVLDRLPEWATESSGNRREITARLSGFLELDRLGGRDLLRKSSRRGRTLADFLSWLDSSSGVRVAILGTHILAALAAECRPGIDLLARVSASDLLREALEELGVDADDSRRVSAVALFAVSSGWADRSRAPGAGRVESWIRRWIEEGESRELIGLHAADGANWVRKEDLEDLAYWRLALGLARENPQGTVESWLDAVTELKRRALEAGYRVDRLKSPAAGSQSPERSTKDETSLSPQAKTAKE